MGSVVTSILGNSNPDSGGAGLGFSANSANILNPTTVDQANTAYTGNQAALTQQQNFVNALQAQNGVQNQSNVYSALQGVANGTGPNPAQAQLSQATGANVANQAALMAGQRGSNANAGLIARQAAQQGATTQQNAAGQAASLQAQQSLNALSAQGNVAGQQVTNQAAATTGLTGSQQAEQSNLLNSIAQQNNANVGMQSNVNSSNAGVSQVAAGQQGALIGNLMSGASAAVGLAEGGSVPRARYADPTGVVSQSDVPQNPISLPQISSAPQPFNMTPPIIVPQTQVAGPRSNAAKFFNGQSLTSSNSPQPQGMAAAGQSMGQALGSGLSSLGSGVASLFNSDGGNSGYQDPSEATLQKYANADVALDQPGSGAEQDTDLPANNGDIQDNMAAQGGKVPALVSPGEKYLAPSAVKKVEKGANPMAVGETIPGKAKVKGAKNSYANDTVPKTLEEGGIVLPRSVTQAKHPHWEAHKFVSALMAKQGKQLPKKGK